MGRVIAIDYGNKRTGLAVSDPEGRIASPMDTVATHDLMSYLERYFDKEEVDIMVVGLPRKLDGSESETLKPLRFFVRAFRKRFPGISVEWMDERFTTSLAQDSMREAGVKRSGRRLKGNSDKISASLILQSWMERKTIRNSRR